MHFPATYPPPLFGLGNGIFHLLVVADTAHLNPGCVFFAPNITIYIVCDGG